MRPFRVLAVALVALSVPLVLPAPAASGGGSVFDFERRYYVPGDVVRGHTRFSVMVEGTGAVDEGPYDAYLVPRSGWIDPPRIPEGSIRVARVRFGQTEAAGLWMARVSFVLPRVPRGRYALQLCNDPCRDSVVGDLLGGWFTVAPTRLAARLAHLNDDLRARLSVTTHRLELQLRKVRREAGRLEASLQLARSAAGSRADALRARVLDLERTVAELRAFERATRTRPQKEPAGTDAVMVVAAAAVLAAWTALLIWLNRRRKTPLLRDGTPHPDFARAR